MLRKHSVPGRPTNFDDSRARAYCAEGAGCGCLDILFLSSIILCPRHKMAEGLIEFTLSLCVCVCVCVCSRIVSGP